MPPRLYACTTAPPRPEREDRSWQEHLPQDWRELVVAPLDLRRYQDYELAAHRVVGYDADGKPCYTAHRFSLAEPRSDDGEEFYTVLAYGEELAAWRLRDERWLVWREVRAEETCEQARSFYCLSQDMPR
ncbi:MAG: hypothetical protein WBH99_02785 [Azovibrio sp.]|uniref:hypothetical protein n=1 Tax=Azovibrio sp. TaxID=1872673 RepID=UPI003C742302